MASQYDHEYPPANWDRKSLAATLESTPERYTIPTYDERAVWTDIETSEATTHLAADIKARAREIADHDQPVPALPASGYLDYTRTGNRSRYQTLERQRRDRLSILTLAECLEREGRYLDAVLDYAWAICEQSSWAVPAHLDDEHSIKGLPGVLPEGADSVKLLSVATALLLTELDYVLGDKLHPALRDRITREVDRRILTPYENRDDHSWMQPPAANWNAVCNGGAAVAALQLLDDTDRQAAIVAKAARSMRHYINGFDPSGATPEGIGYWNYGFENYVKLAATLQVRTDGEYDLTSPPIVKAISEFPKRVTMSPGRYVPFSDTEEDTILYAHLLGWLGEQYGDRALKAMAGNLLSEAGLLFGKALNYNLPEILRDLAWGRSFPIEAQPPSLARRDFLAGCQWWLRRVDPADPDGLVVAAKGGHNDEPHNHNDCGTFVVHVNGESLLTDLGREPYDRDYFSPKRYTDYLATCSLGHSVPYVNGCEQQSGKSYAAEILERESTSDAIAIELGECYPKDAGLNSLVRRLKIHDGSSLTVDDKVVFDDDAPGHEFESILVSYAPMAKSGGALVVSGEAGRATITSTPETAIEVEQLTDAIGAGYDRHEPRDVYRARFKAPQMRKSGVELSIDLESNV